jgi:hypothetical protein
MLKCDLDDLVTSEISTDRRELAALANDVGFISLCRANISIAFNSRLEA